MSLIVEDGTGLTNSNSYVDVLYADSYFSTRGKTEWSTLTTETKEFNLINATDYINTAFKWYGQKLKSEQSLKFPRKNLIDEDGELVNGIPLCLKDAVCECALLVSKGVEMFSKHEQNGEVISEHIGELSFTYANSQINKDTTLYDIINYRMRGLYMDATKNKIVIGRIGKEN